MNSAVKQIFPEMAKNVENGLCPFCRTPIDLVVFRDELSERESKISGLCQTCQDEVFGK